MRDIFDEVKKLFNLKNTEFIIDSDIEGSFCDTYSGKIIYAISKNSL